MKKSGRHVGARDIALSALGRFRRSDGWSETALDEVIRRAGAEPRDAALASRIFYGVLQNMALCDHYIGLYSSIRPERMEPVLLDILRTGAYQLLFLERVPGSAAVNESVRMCHANGLSRASGLANAVLRRISEISQNPPDIPGEGTAEHLSVKYSHPKWLVESYVSRLGFEEAEKLLSANNSPVPLFAQVNTLKATSEELVALFSKKGVSAMAHPWLRGCVEVYGGGNSADLPGFEEGLFYIQDPAARLTSYVAEAAPGIRFLDVCASPGGKSFAAAVDMGGSGRIVSCDVSEKKAAKIREAASRLGFKAVETRIMDARNPDPGLLNAFDAVIADAPCSGLGVIRKKPEIRYKNPGDFESLPQIQLDILAGASLCVAPGGVLVYSTCTTRKEENEAVITRFLEQNPDFIMESFELPGLVDIISKGAVTLWPHLHGTDGFFICKLRKAGRA